MLPALEPRGGCWGVLTALGPPGQAVPSADGTRSGLILEQFFLAMGSPPSWEGSVPAATVEKSRIKEGWHEAVLGPQSLVVPEVTEPSPP